ncbi:MAG: sigma-70 family RNA polymerase sigma factor [Phycisphaerales bacterium]|nr:MAG: sigma-70 family RNA polymerase sigma factor [Phycisphaerales bacterium]
MFIQDMDTNNHRKFDVAAAAEVFLDHKDFIRGVICFHVQDEDYADDLFQDFFLSLVCNPLPRSIQNIESYLYKAITNDIIDAIHRKEKHRNCLRQYRERSSLNGSQKTPAEAVLEMEQIDRVLDLIEKRLPRTEACAVCLQYREGHDAREIAGRMNVGIATVRGYVSEGLSRIRRLLGIKGD